MCAKKPIATKFLAGLALSAAWTSAAAAPVVATVTNLSGPLMVQKTDGSVKILAQKSSVESGDILVSEANTYAQLTFIDKGELVLRPETTLKIEAYRFEEAKPEMDDARLRLLKGGVRWSTGMLAKRSREKFALVTPTASLGVRGTTFVAQYVAPSAGGTVGLGVAKPPGVQPSLAPGLHVFVLDGMINMTNSGGSLNFAAGQFGYVGSMNTTPMPLPTNPGLKFTPPPGFTVSGPTSSNTNQPKAEAVDCEVR